MPTAAMTETGSDQFWFAHFFDHASDAAALNERADDTTIGDEPADLGEAGAGCGVEVEVPHDEQADGAFETGETKCREEKNRDKQIEARGAQRVYPLRKVRTVAARALPCSASNFPAARESPGEVNRAQRKQRPSPEP